MRPAWCRCGSAPRSASSTRRTATRIGPAIADDGTPAGYPVREHRPRPDRVRFDDISDPAHPKPLANLVNFSGHPEFLEGNDLISADYIGPVQRMIDRATGAVTIWTQGAVGTAEPERSSYHSVHERLEFTHRDYAQAEYAGRLLADAVDRRLGRDRPSDPPTPIATSRSRPTSRSQMTDRWYPGPLSHPYPTACRTAAPTTGSRAIRCFRSSACPTARGCDGGLEDLADVIGGPTSRRRTARRSTRGSPPTTSRRSGSRCPENYGAPGYTGLEEDIDVHLQGIRLGEHLHADLLVRAVVRPEHEHRDAHGQDRRATSTSATTGAQCAVHDGTNAGGTGRDLELPESRRPVAAAAADQRR